MDIPADIPAMANALADFERAHWASLPAEVQDTINANRGGSMVDLFARTAEALWAYRADLSNQASQILLAQLATFCGSQGWHNLRDGRGFAMANAVRRDLGEEPPTGVTWPDPADDPEPDPAFVQPEA